MHSKRLQLFPSKYPNQNNGHLKEPVTHLTKVSTCDMDAS